MDCANIVIDFGTTAPTQPAKIGALPGATGNIYSVSGTLTPGTGTWPDSVQIGSNGTTLLIKPSSESLALVQLSFTISGLIANPNGSGTISVPFTGFCIRDSSALAVSPQIEAFTTFVNAKAADGDRIGYWAKTTPGQKPNPSPTTYPFSLPAASLTVVVDRSKLPSAFAWHYNILFRDSSANTPNHDLYVFDPIITNDND